MSCQYSRYDRVGPIKLSLHEAVLTLSRTIYNTKPDMIEANEEILSHPLFVY